MKQNYKKNILALLMRSKFLEYLPFQFSFSAMVSTIPTWAEEVNEIESPGNLKQYKRCHCGEIGAQGSVSKLWPCNN